ncbi:MAG: cytochrome c oxidase subunit 2 [Polyangiales bacterium]|jgi:cytochrome c oxidase subunit 2
MNNIPEGTTQLPPQFSTLAPLVDEMYMLVYWVSIAFTVVITGAMLYFMWKYRRRPGLKAKPTGHSTAMEILWTFTPLVLLGVLFHQGFQGYVYGAVAPEDSIEVRVRGMQWNWEFEHRNGVVANLNELMVPVNQPVKLIMSSSDMLHSFFIPTMRVKRDVVPGMYSTLWFESVIRTDDIDDGEARACAEDAMCPEGFWCGGRVGAENRTCVIPIFCTEYCGASKGITRSAFDDPDGEGRNSNHSTMMADLTVTSEEIYDNFIALGPPPPESCIVQEAGSEVADGEVPDVLAVGEVSYAMPCWGENLYLNSGCTACHGVDGVAQQPAPNWAGLWGAERPMVEGPAAQGDADYIRQSILQPQSQIVAGYAGVNMPPYRFSDNQLNAIAAYIRSLSEQ